jgi:glycosyltransferase involved in cell wall biosynthesis
MSRLAKYYKILWVFPPPYWRQIFTGNASDPSSRDVHKITPSFWTYAPKSYLHYIARISGLRKIWLGWEVSKIKSLLSEMGIKNLILYIWRPQFASYLGCFNEEFACYHVDDEYSFSDIDVPNTKIEKYLLKKSDIVFIHSKTLLKKKGYLNPETYYVPNGVDFDYYRKTMETTTSCPPEYNSIPKPHIGYVGFIKTQLDLELLNKLALKRKDWSFILVGPTRPQNIKKDISTLQSQSNVYFLGGKKPEVLPHYVKEMDVCLMNYRNTSYTNYIYPLKLHEYLSCGKPIVATRLANLQEFESVLYFAEGLEDWIDKIQRALNESDPEIQQRRLKVAEENSWDNRVKTIMTIFQDKLNSKIYL